MGERSAGCVSTAYPSVLIREIGYQLHLLAACNLCCKA